MSGKGNRRWPETPEQARRRKALRDEMKIKAKRRRHWPTTPQGRAYPERIEYLRETLGPHCPGWVEVYEQESGKRPDRYGGVSEEDIARARADPINGGWAAMMLEAKREYCLVRWRTWLDRKFYGSPEAAERAQERAYQRIWDAKRRRAKREGEPKEDGRRWNGIKKPSAVRKDGTPAVVEK